MRYTLTLPGLMDTWKISHVAILKNFYANVKKFFSIARFTFSATPCIFDFGTEHAAIRTPIFSGTAKMRSSWRASQTACGSLEGIARKKPPFIGEGGQTARRSLLHEDIAALLYEAV